MEKHIANVGGCREPMAKTGAKCQSGNLRRTNSTEMKKYMRLKDEIKGRIRATNDNSSQENQE
jgi:hypothetical protein